MVKSFNIFGTEYKLEFVDKIKCEDDNMFCWGDTDGRTHTIRISLKDLNGKKISSKEVRITVLHELIHAIFNEGQYKDESNNEPLVEWVARCLNSLLDQKIL